MRKKALMLAAAASGGMALLEADVILRLIPDTTLVDIGALLVTGFLFGLFFALFCVECFQDRRKTG